MTSTDQKWIKKEVVMNERDANRQVRVIMLQTAMIFGVPFLLIWNDDLLIQLLNNIGYHTFSQICIQLIIVIAVMKAGIVSHELIHGFTWSLFARHGLKSIRFGMIWKELTPYSHCTEPLPIRHYVIGTLMPGVVLGLLPTLLSYFSGNIWLFLFGVFFTAAAAGDLLILQSLRKEKADVLVQDHPEAIGYFVLRKES